MVLNEIEEYYWKRVKKVVKQRKKIAFFEIYERIISKEWKNQRRRVLPKVMGLSKKWEQRF